MKATLSGNFIAMSAFIIKEQRENEMKFIFKEHWNEPKYIGKGEVIMMKAESNGI